MPEKTSRRQWMQKILEEHRQLEASIDRMRTFLENLAVS